MCLDMKIVIIVIWSLEAIMVKVFEIIKCLDKAIMVTVLIISFKCLDKAIMVKVYKVIQCQNKQIWYLNNEVRNNSKETPN